MNAIDKQIAQELIRLAAEAATPSFNAPPRASSMLGERSRSCMDADAPANLERTIINYYLTSLRHSLGVSRLIIQRPDQASPQEVPHQMQKLTDDARLAGRAAYLSALALCDLRSTERRHA